MSEAPPETHAPARRRPTALLALAALLLFAAVAGALAWRQYRDAKQTASTTRGRARCSRRPSSTPTSAGQIGALTSIAQAPVVVKRPTSRTCSRTSSACSRRTGTLFTGGLAWVNREGIVRVSTNSRDGAGHRRRCPTARTSGSAITTGAPFVSEGLTGRLLGEQVIATAVPTRDAAGKLTGVLIGTLRIKASTPSQSSLDLGFDGLAIIDRENQSILAGFVHPKRLEEPGTVRRLGDLGRALRHDGPRWRVGPRPRVRAREGARLDGDPRPAARRDLRGRAPHARPRDRAARRRRAARPRPAGLDLRAGARGARASSASARASGASATSRSTRSPRRCSGACSSTCRRSTRSTRPPATRPAAPASRSAATGSTCSAAPTASCT